MTRRIHGEDLSGADLRDVDLSRAEIRDVDLSRAAMRDVDLTGARLRGVFLVGADIDGVITGLTVNGVEVAPLVEAELDRRHPERRLMRPTTADGARQATAAVTSLWERTLAGARPLADRSVHGEWTLTETLRHLVFAVDAWFGHALLGEAAPFHPAGLPPSFVTDGPAFGIDPAARPSFEDAVRLHSERLERVSAFLADSTDDDLTKPRDPNPVSAFPPPATRTAIECLRVLFSEEWAHHRYAVRDLAVLREAGAGAAIEAGENAAAEAGEDAAAEAGDPADGADR